MKKILTLALLLAAVPMLPAAHAQQHRHGDHKQQHRPDITELVSDLNSSQKSKLETITNESRQRVDRLRARQKAVRDSISMFMDRDGDQSKTLYPLFDREARLQAELSREMYATKPRIDQILTPEQRSELLKVNKKHRNQRKK